MSADAAAADAAGSAEPLTTSERLAEIVTDASGDKIQLGDLLDAMGERAFGVFLLILALPCCIPFLYGVPQIVAVPLLFVSAQLVGGRSAPWLPTRLRQREVAVASLSDLLRRAGPYLRFFERLSRPRLTFLTRTPVDRLIGLFLLLFSASILLPIPSTNTVPGIAVAIAALGLLERDGLLVGAGVAIGTAWIAALVVVGETIVSWLLG